MKKTAWLLKILPYPGHDVSKLEKLKETISQLSEEDTQKMILLVEEGELDDKDYILESLSHEQLASLKNFTKNTLKKILPNPYSDQSKQAELKQKLSAFKKELICKMADDGELDDKEYLLAALSNEQIQALKEPTKDRLIKLFPNPFNDEGKKAALKQKLSLLNEEFTCKMLQLVEAGELESCGYILESLSHEQIASLKTCTKKTLTKILPEYYSDQSKKAENQLKLNKLDKKIVCQLVEEGELDKVNYLIGALSLEQVASLKELKKSTVERIINCSSEEERKQKIRLLYEGNIRKRLEVGDLDDLEYFLQKICKALTKKQLGAIQIIKESTLEKMLPNPESVCFAIWGKQNIRANQTKVKQKIGALNKELICQMVEDGSLTKGYFLKALSDELLSSLKTLTAQTLAKLVPYNENAQKVSQRLSHVNKELIASLVEEGDLNHDKYLLQALSKEHIGSLKKISTTTLAALIPNSFGNEQEKNQ